MLSSAATAVETVDEFTDVDPSEPEGQLELAEAPDETAADVLKRHKMWEGWTNYYTSIPLGPGKELRLPQEEVHDPELYGFATPLAAVEFARRNERRYPPPSDEDMFREMYMLVQIGLKGDKFRRSAIMFEIWGHINRNRRDSPGYQRNFIKAGGVTRLLELWREPQQTSAEPEEFDEKTDNVHYWVVAILGRMAGTNTDSRVHLISEVTPGLVDIILEAIRSPEEEVRDCSLQALKGIVMYPEGRQAVPYQTLIEALGLKAS